VLDWLYPYFSGAGRAAGTRYRVLAVRWRARVWRRTWWIAAMLLFAALLVAVLDRSQLWLWLAGLFLGGLIGGYAVLLDSPPAHIENWRTGLEGERRTARALAPLRRRGFVLLHDLPDRRRAGEAREGNLDHVVVSGAGVFLLDSKWLGGAATILGETVHVEMRDNEEDSYDLRRLARVMRGRAVRLQEDIVASTGVRFVQPVVVFWNCFEPEILRAENVVFIHGSQLASWLQRQPVEKPSGWIAHVGHSVCQARPAERPSLRDRLWRPSRAAALDAG
jgi:hypothetical protein